jgi:hypothetical protein
MFGISPLGWLHTLGSLPALPAAAYMLLRHGRIIPRSKPGAVYFVSMLTGGMTVFLIATQAVSYGIGVVTILLLLAGYGVGYATPLGNLRKYLETIFLSLTVCLLMLPAVSETLRRVPNGHPFVTNPHSPLLIGTMAGILLILIIGLPVQLLHLRRQGKLAAAYP